MGMCISRAQAYGTEDIDSVERVLPAIGRQLGFMRQAMKEADDKIRRKTYMIADIPQTPARSAR